MKVTTSEIKEAAKLAKANIFDIMPAPALLLDSSGIVLEANQAFQRLFGLAENSIQGCCFLDMLAMDAGLKDTIRKNYAAHMYEGRTMSFESYIPTVSGKGIWAVVDSRVFDQGGQILCITTLKDISVEKKALAGLEDSKRNAKDLFDNGNDMVQSTGPDGRIVYANKKWLQAFGYEESELSGLYITDILREDQVSHYAAILERVKNGEQFEFVDTIFRTKDGREMTAEGNIRGQFEGRRFVAMCGIFRDVTYKKNLEESYSSLIEYSPTAIYVVQNGKFKFVNSSFRRLTGYSEKELIDRESLSLVFSEDKSATARSAVNSLKSRRPNSYEFRLVTKEGEVRWVMETVISIPFEEGRAALGTVVDLSEHKMFEKALEEANARYQTLFNSAGDAIYIHDTRGNFLEVNDAACELLGYKRSELLKLNIGAFFFPNDPQAVKNYLQEITTNRLFFADIELAARGDRQVPVEINCKLVSYENRPAILTVARDITERKQIEMIRTKNQARSESLLKIAEYPLSNAQDLLYFGLEEMVKLAESKYGFLYAYDEAKDRLSLRALSKDTYRVSHLFQAEQSCQLAEAGILGETIRRKKPIISSTRQTPGIATNGFPDGNYKIDRYMAVPIWRNNKIVGIAGTANKSQDYESSDVQQVSLLVNSVWSILEKLVAEKTLAESELRYRQLVNLSQDGIFRLNTDAKILMVNPAALEMFGYTEEEMLGRSLKDTMIASDQEIAAQKWKYLKEEKAGRYERLAVRKDGSTFPLEVSVSTLTQGYYQEVVRDISTRKEMEFRLQESEKKYRQMVDNQSDLIAEMSPATELTFLNPAYLKLLGKTETEMIGTRATELIHPDDVEKATRESTPVYRPPYITHSESRMMTRIGWRWIAWNINGVPGPDGKVASLTCTGRDITESKQAKEDLEQANQRLRELDKLKDNFLSTVSHELRTPLTSIKSFTEILLSYDEDPATQKEFLGIINNESDRLTRLINDFLDISKIQAGRMQWKTEPVAVAEAIQQAINSARPLIEKELLHLECEIEPNLPMVMSDRDRLVQVMTNLLGNAIKFTPEDGKIKVKAWCNQEPKNPGRMMVTVSISDSGIGIAAENHHKIFENFGQVGDVLKDRPRGTGLGLPICKKIIETFGGSIWLESELGKGSTFFFSLPQAPADPGAQKNTGEG